MGKFSVSARTVLRFDASAGGALEDKSQYIDTITPMGKLYDQLDVSAFSDAGERVIAGIQTGQEITLEGAFDDTATTGPDAILSTAVGNILTMEYNPVGTASGARKMTGEFLVMNYVVGGNVKERVGFSTVWKLDGTVTLGAN